MTLCNYFEGGSESLTNDICKKYPVSKENTNTHICIKEDSKCVEKYLCESVPKPEGDTEIDCSIYTVKYENIDTHKCVRNTNGDNPCKEEDIIITERSTFSFSSSFPSTILESQTNFPEIEKLTSSNTEKILSTSISDINTELSLKSTDVVVPNTTELIANNATELVVLNTTELIGINITELIANNTTKADIINFPTTIIEKNEIMETLVVLMGFSRFMMQTSSFSFMIHFISVRNYLHSQFLSFPLIYNSNLRVLENQNANCTMINSQSMTSYLCQVQASTSNIKEIKTEPDFNFLSQNIVSLIGITPLARMFMNNIQNTEDKYNLLLNPNQTIFIIDNSTLYRNGTHQFIISGTLVENKPKTDLKNKNLILMTNIESVGDDVEKEINCTVIDVINNNYTLTCRAKENIRYDLQSSISFIDKGIILINYDKVIQGNETIFYPQIETKGSRYYHYNKSRGLNVGSILAIIFALLAAILATGTIMVCFRKKSNHVENNQSTIYSLKSNN